MFPSSACRSPRISGAWPGIDATGGRSPRRSSRPYSVPSQIGNDARSPPKPEILPQKYDKSEKLHLELWDPHRLAAHVMATLSPEDERAAAALDFILENKISSAFLAHYTYDIDAMFPDAIENTEIIRLIVQTIPHIFWIKPCEPLSGRRNLREVVKEIRASIHLVCEAEANPVYTSTTKHAPPSLVSDWEQEEVEVEVTPLDPIETASDGASTSDGRRGSGAHRVWAWVRHTVCLPRSTFEDWGAAFTFLSGLIRGWRDKRREIFNPQTHQHSSPRAREPYSGRAGAGMGDRSNVWG